MGFSKSSIGNYREIVREDCYLLNNWPYNFFESVLDIGANEGMFSICIRMRHWAAAIHACEPCKRTFAHLTANTCFLKDITCTEKALGNGQPLFFHNTRSSSTSLFFTKEEREPEITSYSVPSCTLGDLCREHPLKGKHYIKIDTEGGERFLLDDPEAVDVLKCAHGVGLEVHFPPTNPKSPYVERYRCFPPWQQYNDWIYDNNFQETHRIIYHHSSKKDGSGVYVLIAKE